jgi:hypothetical protein
MSSRVLKRRVGARAVARAGGRSRRHPDPPEEALALGTNPTHRPGASFPSGTAPAAGAQITSGQVLNDLHELVHTVALPSSEFDKLFCLLDDRAAFRCPDDGNATAAAELKESLVAE